MHVHVSALNALVYGASALLILFLGNWLAAQFPQSTFASTWLALSTGKDL